MPIKLEIDIENAFREWVRGRGGRTYKWTGSRKKLDLIVVPVNGPIGLCEVKRPGGRPSPQQEELIAEVEEINPESVIISDDFDVLKNWYLSIERMW